MVRLATRAIAVVPAVLTLAIMGDDSTVGLLIATQVVLSLQLPFALVPLIRFTADPRLMGAHASAPLLTLAAALAAVLITACNAWLVLQTVSQHLAFARTALVLAGGAGLALLAYLALVPLPDRRPA
jgi:manganese transport protein